MHNHMLLLLIEDILFLYALAGWMRDSRLPCSSHNIPNTAVITHSTICYDGQRTYALHYTVHGHPNIHGQLSLTVTQEEVMCAGTNLVLVIDAQVSL